LARLSLIDRKVQLARPYHLSFDVLNHFDVFYVLMEDGMSFGIGEITPLPGYGSETPDDVERSVAIFGKWIREGRGLKDSVSELWEKAPFTASGIACAIETLEPKVDRWFGAPAPCQANLAALCAGVTAEEAGMSAELLVGEGYRTLKMKVGGLDPKDDAGRVKAAAANLGEAGTLRLDANQSLSMEQALVFCDALEGVLESIECLEQPFGRDAWGLHEELSSSVSLPIMFDESVWSLEDVRRAADSGARAVKFKLCKHPGMKGTRDMVSEARRLGLDVVYGNGVQSALGNHLEMISYCDSGLTTAFEGNGFLKPVCSPIPHAFSVRGGRLTDGGLRDVRDSLRTGKIVFSTEFPGRLLNE
jgi:L-Ala-D/L-Glu epimerase